MRTQFLLVSLGLIAAAYGQIATDTTATTTTTATDATTTTTATATTPATTTTTAKNTTESESAYLKAGAAVEDLAS